MADWRCLHSDMLMLVARNLKEVPAHLAFAAVCASWRSVALEIRPSFPRPVPGFMLPGKSNSFVSLAEQRLYKLGQIHLSDDDVCLGSHGGWLFIMHQNFEISLLNPFSRKRLSLPPMTSFPKLGEADFDLIHEFYVHELLLYPKSVPIAAIPPVEHWPLNCGGRYLVELVGGLVLVERSVNIFDGVVGQDNGTGDGEDEVGFDVEDLGTKHDVDWQSWYRTVSFSVYKMDFDSHKWLPLKDLSNHIIFVGRNTAFSTPVWSSQQEECKGNCIYFTDDYDDALTPYSRSSGTFYGYDMGVFDVKNGIIKPRNGNGKKLFPPPMWVNYLPW